MKAARPIVTLIALGAILLGVYYFLFPPPEKVIRKRISKLAQAISAKPQGNMATIANINRIGSFFHSNVSITVEGFGTDFTSIHGRGELQQMALAARQRIGSLSVEFYNVEVIVAPDKTTAKATATILVKLNGDNNPITQDVRIEFEKDGRNWLIHSAVPQKSLKLE